MNRINDLFKVNQRNNKGLFRINEIIKDLFKANQIL